MPGRDKMRSPRAVRICLEPGMVKLTEEVIEALACEPGRKDRLVFDDVVPGLAIRVSTSGNKAFLAQYAVAGRQSRRVPIGRWGAVTLKQARLVARGILGDVAKGIDVAQVRSAQRKTVKAEATADKMTLATLLKQWDDLALADQRQNYRYEAVRAIKAAFPSFMERRADKLTRLDAMAALDALGKAGRAAMAGRTLAYGRACYTWALRRGIVPSNPFLDIPIGSGTVSRDRVLTEAELRVIWQATEKLGWPFCPLYRLLILTAQRREEVAGMAWSEFSADCTMWVIPKERSKNGKAHIVHLAPAARAILTSLPHFTSVDDDGREVACDLVFTTNGKTPVSGFSRAKERLDGYVADLRTADAVKVGQDKPTPMLSWRIHDFRRTAVTWMAEHGVAPHVADRLLNHVQGTISGVAAVYQRGEFLAERKAALEVWAARCGS